LIKIDRPRPMSRKTYSIEDIENNEDLLFKTDELSGTIVIGQTVT